jgi:hypothetical protein
MIKKGRRFFPMEADVKHLLAVLVAVGSAALSVAAQSSGSAGISPGAKAWKVPRTPDGKPDLQGVWGNNAVTPMTRPTQWKEKTSLTDAEVQELRGLAARFVDQGKDAIFGDFVQLVLDAKNKGKFNQLSYDPTTGNYNQFWMSDREWDNRTSLITDPPDGQFPPLTPDGKTRQAAFLRQLQEGAPAAQGSENGPTGRADGPEDRPMSERCISYGAPWTSPGYDSYFQIVQSPQAVVIQQELIHDARVVPMSGAPHLPQTVRQLHGDSKGHWDGDTLVVETTNYLNGFQAGFQVGSSPGVRLTERYTRVSQDYINWELTVDDPATWTRPWTFMIRLKRTAAQLYEYACHEGNVAMTGILAGARAQEKAVAQAVQKTAK